MRKFTEVLRLRFELGLSLDQIACSCSISQASVSNCLKRARAAGVSWPLPEGWDEARLEEALFGQPLRRYETRRPTPDFARLHQELQSNRHLTLELLWEEYRQSHPDGYAYSRFCELYHRWRRHLDVVLRHEHKAGEKLFVDYAGDTIPIHDPKGGPTRPASIFVAVLGASNYTYAEATWTQGLEDWLGAHVRAFKFLGAVPKLVVPDNTKTGVSRACRYEPDLNPAYQEMARHYGVGVLPTRPAKPRDKAKVEAGVLMVERWIVAALRHRKFFSLAELNQAIRELVEKLKQRPFRKRHAIWTLLGRGFVASSAQVKWMTPEQHKRVKELFDAALDMDPTEQESFLAKSCWDDDIRAEVRSLLWEHQQLEGFMQKPALPAKPPRSFESSKHPPVNDADLE
jgi:transposase